MLACLRNNVARPLPGSLAVRASFTSSSSHQNDSAKAEFKSVASDLQNSNVAPTSYMPNPDSLYRTFRQNQFIRPGDLSYESVRKRRALPVRRAEVGPSKMDAKFQDPFYPLGVDPLSQAMNPAMLFPFISEMGKVFPRSVTGLTKKNQRRVGKAIRRAKMMGILPVLSKRNIFQPFRTSSYSRS